MTSALEEVKIIVGTITATLSLIGSTLLICTILKSEKKLKKAYRRIIFGASVFDVFQSFGFASSILMSPKGVTPYAIGNVASCSVQGFFFTVGAMAVTFYLQSLCIYYFCIIRLNMRSPDFVKKVEPGLHLMPILYSLAVGIYALTQNYYNYNGTICLTTATPANCESEPDVECERGEGALQWTALFLAGPSMLAFLTICVVMALIVCSAKKLERRNKQYLNRYSANHDRDVTSSHWSVHSKFLSTIHFSIRHASFSVVDGHSLRDTSSKRFISKISCFSRNDSSNKHNIELTEEDVCASEVEIVFTRDDPAPAFSPSLEDFESNEAPGEEEDKESDDATDKATKETIEDEESGKSASTNDAISIHLQDAGKHIDTLEPIKRDLSDKRSASGKGSERTSGKGSATLWPKTVLPHRNTKEDIDEENGASAQGIQSNMSHRRRRRRLEQTTLRTREINKQALLYTGSYFLTYGFPWAETIYVNATGKEAPTLLGILIAIFFPLQGFINIFIYCRPHIVSLRKKYPENYTWLQAFIVVMRSGGDSQG